MNYSQGNNEKRVRRQRSQVPRVKNKLGVTIFRAVVASILIGGFALMGAGLGIYMGIIRNSPTLNLMAIKPENYTSFIVDSKTGEEIDRLTGEENRVYVTFDRIPANLKNAFVAIEDERFYSHNGVDFRGMARALKTIIQTQGARTEGASTITQQLIKNNLGRYDSDLITKLQEQYLAVQFEKRLAEPDMLGSKELTKDYILEVYMNAINLGRGCYGVQAAARYYYGKDVSELDLAECATIAAITQNPSKYPPDIRPENNQVRQQAVLKKMNELGYITDSEYQAALADPVYDRIVQGINPADSTGVVHSYFTDALINEVSRDLQAKYQITETESYNWIYSKGLKIYSTQDLAMQAIMDEVFSDDSNFPAGDYEIDILYIISVKNAITGKIENYEKKKTVKSMEDVEPYLESVRNELLTANDDILADQLILTEQPQASMVIIDYHNGQVKAITGGRGEKQINRSFNRALDAYRSPGSQFKVVASYAPALDLGRITAATVIDDVPYTYVNELSEPYSPRNWWGSTYEGLSNVRRGIYRSMNILAVKNLMSVGIDTSFAYLLNFGFTTLVEGEWKGNQWLTDKVPPLALGGLTYGVKQVELCAAYGTIANLGEYNKPIFYTKVLDHDGNILLENTPEPQQVLKRATSYVLTDMMRDTVRVGTGGKAGFENVKMPVAGKTGTSTSTKDLGFTGYTPYYAASVWMGYDQQKEIRDSNGNHLILWRKVMEEVHKDLPEKDFEKPDGLVYEVVCKDSGMLATDLCRRDPRGDRSYREIFISGTQPTDYCEVHQEVLVDNSTNMLAGAYCPPEEVSLRVGIVRSVPVEEDVEILDRPYEITPEMLSGVECTVHSSGYNPNIDYNWGWSDMFTVIPTPTPLMPEYPWSTPVPTVTNTEPGDTVWPGIPGYDEDISNPDFETPNPVNVNNGRP